MADKFFDQEPRGRGESADLGSSVPMWGDLIPGAGDPQEEDTPREDRSGFEETEEPKFFQGIDEVAESIEDEGDEPQDDPDQEVEASEESDEEAPDYQALQEELETLKKRLHDTQSWGNQNNMDRLINERIAQTLQQLQAQQGAQAQWEEQNKPPSVDDLIEDAERLLTDPDALKSTLGKAMRAYAEWGENRALSKVSPHLAQAQSAAEFLNDTYPLLHTYARDKSVERARSLGMVETDEQADRLLEKAYTLIDEQGGAKAPKLRLNPEIVTAAMRSVVDKEGAPVKKKPKKPPSAGKSPSGSTSRKRGSAARKTKRQKAIEKILGTKISDDKIQAVNERRRAS